MLVFAQTADAGVDRWAPIGPDGGEILALAADPDAPGVLYAATQAGGVWKSLDGGMSWTATPENQELARSFILSLSVSAGRVYASNFYGTYVLADGAATWRQSEPYTPDILKFAFDPAEPAKLWGAGNGGVLLSEDGGGHWSPKLNLEDSFQAVAIAPTVPPTVYAAGTDGVFASRDGGTSWRQLSHPDFEGTFDIAVDPADAETLYLSSGGDFSKTADGGEHWSFSSGVTPSNLLVLSGGSLLGAGFDSQGPSLWRSEDRGDTWETLPLPRWNFFGLAADPAAPAGAWLGRQGGGLLRTSDGGRTWTPIRTRGLGASFIQAFAFDPFRPRTLYASTTELSPEFIPVTRFQRSVDAGASWTKTPTLLNVRVLAADPRRPGTLYAGTPQGVSISRDRGAHWQRVLHDPKGIETVAVDPERPGTILAGGYRLWRSQDAGRTWELLPNPLATQSLSSGRRFLFSPWHPGALFLVDFHRDGVSVQGSVWRSTDRGSTWEPTGVVEPIALAFAPSTPGLLYVVDAFGALRKSHDGGTTWELVASGVAEGSYLSDLLVDPLDPAVLYVGTVGRGVWRSRDQGVTWQPYSTGLVSPTVFCLQADPHNPRRLVACTWGGGLLEIRTSS